MMRGSLLRASGLLALALLGTGAATAPASAESAPCMDCLEVRVGPAKVIRGPFPDELDAPFNALKLSDGTFRGFSANGATYAIEGTSLWDMDGPRRAVLQPGAEGTLNDCGQWLTSTVRSGNTLVGMVHQERDCDYNLGRTDKSMAIATSNDDGLTWTDAETVLTGRDSPLPDRITGEGDCTMVDGFDGYLYGYCLRNSDWQTIVARAPLSDPTDWHKYFDGGWNEPGLRGNATAIGFLGPGAGYLREHGWVATVTADPWFNGVRLSLSTDKVAFADLDEPFVPIEGSEWNRPADTSLIAYTTVLNPEDGSNVIEDRFALGYIYVPEGKGFESRYLVLHDVSLTLRNEPQAVQVGVALTRWSDPAQKTSITSTGPLTGDLQQYTDSTVVAYMLTRAPENGASIKFAECSQSRSGYLDYSIADEGSCGSLGYDRQRTAGWLFVSEQAGTVAVYQCRDPATGTRFASNAADCEGLGAMDFRLGYGLAP